MSLNVGGDVSEHIVRDGMIIIEEGSKIFAHLTKEAIMFLLALAKSDGKIKGSTSIKHLLEHGVKTGQTVEVFHIKKDDVKQFTQLAKEFGVLYHPVVMESDKSEFADMVGLSGDLPAINRIYEKLGYPVPEGDAPKNADARATSEPNLNERGSGYEQQARNNDAPQGKSVVADLKVLKAQVAANRAKAAPKAPTPKVPTR